jgi:arsenate reductase
MKKIYHLSTCKTCQKVIAQLNNGEGFDLQDIKTEKITPEQLDFMKEKVGSYEALFSRRAMKYRSMGLNEKELSEDDYRNLILEEYTFLKRPVVVIDDEVFVGSAKKAVEGAKQKMGV